MNEDLNLPPGWNIVKLGSVTDEILKINPKEKPNDEFIYIDISSIDNNQNRISNPKKYIGQDAPSRARQSVATGDILFSTVRTYLKNIAKVSPEFDGQVASTGFCVIRPKQSVFRDYLFYIALSDQFINPLTKIQRGTSYPAVRNSDVFDQNIPIPPYKVQKHLVSKIEELFTQLDAGIAELKESKARLESYRQSVLKAAVTGELTREWREAHQDELEPADQLLERILAERRKKWEVEEWAKLIEKAQKKAAQAQRKAAGLPSKISDLKPKDWEDIGENDYTNYLPKNDKWKDKFPLHEDFDKSELPVLPSSWIWTNFDLISDGTQSALKAGPFGSSLKKEYYTSSGYKIYGQEQVIGQNPYIGNYYIDEQRYKKLKTCSVKPGDMLISLVGTIGKVLILPNDIQPGIINPRLVKLSLNKTHVLAEFIKYYIYSFTAKHYFQISSHGGTMDILNLTILRGLPIPLPNISEQKLIVQMVERRLSVVDEIKKELYQDIKRADRLRQSILKQAFEGKLV